MANWGKRIKEARELQNLTQSELAKMLGTDARTVRRWESEESVPDVFMGIKLAKILNTKAGKLFQDDYFEID